MEIFFKIVSLLGGLAMFLYGMRIMGDGLKSTSGGAMKAALARVTDKPFKGFLLGLIVTCMIQSSTAAIVLTVGLVGAGFLTFRQSIGIVLGVYKFPVFLQIRQLSAYGTCYRYYSDNVCKLESCTYRGNNPDGIRNTFRGAYEHERSGFSHG